MSRLNPFRTKFIVVVVVVVVVAGSSSFSCCSALKQPDYVWQHLNANDPVPSNAITGGIIIEPDKQDPGLNVFVARKKINGQYRIGKLYDPKKVGKWLAFFLIDGDEKVTTNEDLEVLVVSVPDMMRWMPTSGGVIPRKAVYFSTDAGTRRYVCRGIMKGTVEKALVVVPGETTIDLGWCQTFWYTRGIHMEYQVLLKLDDDDNC